MTFTETKVHTHSFSSVWEHNDISHWHQCTCGEHADEAFHTYTWTVLKAPTATEDGEQKGVCSVCGYETIQPIPAGSDTDAEDETPEKPSKKTNTVLLVIIGVLAVAVIAVAVILIRKVLLQKDEEDSGDDDDGSDE